MSSRNPFNFTQANFTDLLNSQQDSNISDSNPLLPNSTQTSELNQFNTPFSSQPLQFSSPFSSQPLQFSCPTVPEECIQLSGDDNEAEGGKTSRLRWTNQEDVKLISAWLNTSKDPVVGNEQRVDCFWKRIAAYFQASEGASTRGPVQCKARWSKINKDVNKFVGCYSQASARKKSGESEDDVLSLAHVLYKNDMKKAFNLGHCWRELKNDQKWNTADCSSKRSKLDAEGAYSSSSTNDGVEVRPPGVKASKKKGKTPLMSNDVEDSGKVKLDRIIAMKDKEQAAKERQGKMKVLQSLLNKTDLTPAQVILRDKLQDQMFSSVLECHGKPVKLSSGVNCGLSWTGKVK
ncbi:glutathione S-transferase T3-like [Capsella rubella]|uniref:glutathione S-transferase T3-like n=1 Tax=Capsella rubella TaxID=81985 RepID=UPI000CD49C32|nr:glutathione S-transferase T3-like [Capsella rubella]